MAAKVARQETTSVTWGRREGGVTTVRLERRST